MIKRDELSIGTSCLSRASMMEPVFVLRAHDRLAPQIVREWANRYRHARANNGTLSARQQAKYSEAMTLAESMEEWREKNTL